MGPRGSAPEYASVTVGGAEELVEVASVLKVRQEGSRNGTAAPVRLILVAGQGMPQRVLYIESDASTRVLVRRLLEASGLAVDESATRLDKIALAHSVTPDLVLADTRLPDIGEI